jgi:diguanylate cyclase (GGDEF)-like protein/PAS domain S-box-containing protein
MSSWTHDTLIQAARRVAWLAAALVAAIGACSLVGWSFGIAGASRLLPDAPSMTANAAIASILFGIALFAHARPPRRPRTAAAARAAGRAGTLLAAVVGVQWVLGVDLGVDQLLFTATGPDPGRMGPMVCLALLLLGTALELDRRRRIDGRLVNLVALAPLLLGLLSISGYVSGVTSFTELGGTLRIALPSAVVLVAAGIALLLARPQRGAVRLLVSSGPGGLLARRLLPLAVVLPLALDGLRLELADARVLSTTTGNWAFAFLILTLFAAVVLRLARGLDLLEVGRHAAEERLRAGEAQARSITDTAHDAIVSAGANGWITLFNPAAERLFGWDAAEVLGRPITLLIPERHRGAYLAELAAITGGTAAAAEAAPLERRGLTKAGGEFDLELSLAQVDHGGGLQVTAIMRDISARKLLEELAREQTARGARIVAAQTAIAEGAGGLGSTLDLVAAEAREIVGADGAVVELPDGEEMVYRAAAGAGVAHLGARVPVSGSLSGAVLLDGETAICHDAETDPRVDREACRRIGVRSMVCVALRHRDETVGVLKAYSAAVSAFSDRDARTLELLAGLAAATVHRAQVERRLAALHAVGAALGGARSVQDGLAGALAGLGEQLGWAIGAVWLVDARDGSLACAESWHERGLAAGSYLALCETADAPGAGGLLDGVRRTSAPAWLEHVELAPDASVDPRRARAASAAGVRTLAAVPIVSRGETLGVVELGSREALSHDGATLLLVADVATAIGQFVQRRRAEDRMTVQAVNLAAVAELSHTLAQVPGPAETRPALVRAIRDLGRADSVMLLEPDGPKHLAITAEAGGLAPVGTRLHLERDVAVAIDVFRSGRGRFVADFATEPRAARPIQDATQLRSAHYEPLIRDGETTGVIVIATRELRSKDAGGLDALMRLLAGEASSALALSDLVATLDARARTDQLTGLANRRAWDEELPRELARAARAGQPLSLAIIDLDRFKVYNDTHGHPAGDRLLRSVAAAWTERLRLTDVLARYGGEEFAVLLPGCDPAAAELVAETLRCAVPGPETCSIGLVTWDGEESDDALFARADAALYRAKDSGRDRVVAA